MSACTVSCDLSSSTLSKQAGAAVRAHTDVTGSVAGVVRTVDSVRIHLVRHTVAGYRMAGRHSQRHSVPHIGLLDRRTQLGLRNFVEGNRSFAEESVHMTMIDRHIRSVGRNFADQVADHVAGLGSVPVGRHRFHGFDRSLDSGRDLGPVRHMAGLRGSMSG